MMLLPTVILEHRQAAGTHLDWMLATPEEPAGRLWTARLRLPPMHWATGHAFLLEVIQPHRRAFLEFQGELTGGRGLVKRVDRGAHQPRLWTSARSVLEIRTQHFEGTVELRRLGAGPLWRGLVLQRCKL